MKMEFTRTEVDERFRILAALLAVTPLPTEAGGTRTATADEFMLMHEKPGPLGSGIVTAFKHRDTRNYAFVLTTHAGPLSHRELYVPKTPEPFMRGFFDVFEALPYVERHPKATVPPQFMPEEDPRCDG